MLGKCPTRILVSPHTECDETAANKISNRKIDIFIVRLSSLPDAARNNNRDSAVGSDYLRGRATRIPLSLR